LGSPLAIDPSKIILAMNKSVLRSLLENKRWKADALICGSEHHAAKKCLITNKNIDRALKELIQHVNANVYAL
jgi:hypothetical protein